MSQDWAEFQREAQRVLDALINVTDNDAILKYVARELRDAEQRGFRRGVESAAKILQEHANGYADLRTMALEQKDIKSAFANLCESQACLITVKDVRALLSEKTEGER